MGTTYDGALLAAEANRRELWAIHARSLQRGERPVVPAGVLGQAWRGGPQAQLSRLLRGCRIEDLDEGRARGRSCVCALCHARRCRCLRGRRSACPRGSCHHERPPRPPERCAGPRRIDPCSPHLSWRAGRYILTWDCDERLAAAIGRAMRAPEEVRVEEDASFSAISYCLLVFSIGPT
jgi:hypothetical protein